MTKAVAFIPARSGSKRVVDKNIRRIGGHPMIAYAIASAVESGVFDDVVVSTDSEEYARIARHYGASVPCLRPADFASSTASDIDWVEHMIDHLAAEGRSYDCFSILRPTSPFRQVETIRRAWQQFSEAQGVDSLRAIEKVGQHPGKMWVVRDNRMLPLMPLTQSPQPWHSMQMAALPEVFVQNASLEIAWTRVVKEGRSIAGTVILPFFTDDMEGFDINIEFDWEYAEKQVATGQFRLPEVNVPPID